MTNTYRQPRCQKHSSQLIMLNDLYLDCFGYITDGRFVEVGAFNCINWSNTLCLVVAGWSGISIEPQPGPFGECVELHKDNPGIILENCCVGRESGKAKLFLGGSNSTIKPGTVDLYNDIGDFRVSGLDKKKFIMRDVFTLDHILDKHGWEPRFEVLVVDVEGAELDVLAGFSVDKWMPKMAIVETHALHPDERLRKKAGPIDEYFMSRGYAKVEENTINTVYVVGV